MAAPTLVSGGTPVTFTTTGAPGYPSSFAAGDDVYLCAASGDSTVGSAPLGWTQIASVSGGGVSNLKVFKKDTVLGTESGSVTVTSAAGTKGRAWMSSYRPPAGYVMSVAVVLQLLDTTSDTVVSPSASMTTAVDDLLVVFAMGAGDFSAGGFTGFNLTQSGATLGALDTVTAGRTGTNTLQHFQVDKPVTTGATGTVTATGTGNATGATGVAAAIVLRPTPAVTGYPIKHREGGTWVDYILFLRWASAWTGLASFHQLSGADLSARTNLPFDVAPDVTHAYTSGYSTPVTETVKTPWGLDSPPAMGHYFTQFNVSVDNKDGATDSTEYYRRVWLPPGAVEGSKDWRIPGGWIRDRHPTRPPRTGDWQLADVRTEIEAAIEGKLDGFFIDLLSMTSTSNHTKTTARLFDAADAIYADTGKVFWLIPMIDGTAKPSASIYSGTTIDLVASANAIADYIASFRNRRSFWRHRSSGKFILPIYAPDQWPSSGTMGFTISNPTSDRVAFWSNVKSRLESYWHVPTDLWFCYQNTWNAATTADRFNSIVYGHGRWGDRDANTVAASTTANRLAPSTCHTTYGKKWMHFIAPGDTRPNDGTTAYRSWENKGSLTFEGCWNAAIDGAADMVQMTTWSDLGEGAHIMPSRNHGHVWLDLNLWWLTKYKTGSYPVIKRDGLYLLHRVHPAGWQGSAHFPGTLQTKWATNAGGTSWVDIVEVRCFATAASTLQVLIDGVVTYTQAVTAGMTRWEFALPASGVLSARLQRSAVTVPGTVATSSINLGDPLPGDDYHYRAFSSLRQYTGT